MVRREREEEKGERGHRVTSVKKLDNFPRLRLVNMPNFRLGLNFPPYLGTLSTVVSDIAIISSGLSIGCLGQASTNPGPGLAGLIRFSDFKFGSASAKGTRRSSALREPVNLLCSENP
ncbi:hypothetical protein TNCV_2705652 [Trichonephila clavipes]|nr:hypothetical protein TNCV_2705652 [Trichonephila clavipes]